MLQPQFTFCLDKGCSTFTFTDTTGTYDEILNPGGYGAPNIALEDVVSAVVKIETGTTSQQISLTLSDPPVIEDLENITFTSTDLGFDIVDGVYTITYTVANSLTYSIKKQEMFFACNAECCVYKMSTKVSTDTAECNTPAINNFLNAYTYLQVLKNAARAGQNTKFTNTLTLLNKLCTASGCGCGCGGGC